MENDKIYNLIEKMYSDFISRFEAIDNRFEAIDNRFVALENEVRETKKAVLKVEQVIHDKVGILFDADTRTQEQLAEIKEELQFLTHKEQDNEKELFKIKNKLEVAK